MNTAIGCTHVQRRHPTARPLLTHRRSETASEPAGGAFDAVVVGLGPVGQLAAAQLGRRGLRVLALDAAPGPSREPRAAALDDESLRILQAVGAAFPRLDAPPVQLRGLHGRAVPVPSPRARPFGHPPLALVHQPALEAGLLAVLAGLPSVEVAWGTRWEALEAIDAIAPSGRPEALAAHDDHDDHDAVRLRVRRAGAAGSEEHRAGWLLACDGARSPVRAALGIPFAGSTFVQPWLVVDARVPWAIGAEPRTQFVGDPRRPAVNLPLGRGRHRWEFMLGPGEDEAAMRAPASLARLLAPWVDLGDVELERVAVYTFHARRAARWRARRVLLLGDAAHVMPPFAGQGLAAGLRDAGNACWKVADVVAGSAPAVLLDTYEPERRPSTEEYTRLAERWGAGLQTRRRRAARLRDGALGGLPRLPGLAGWLERGGPRPRPALVAGLFVPGGGGGRLFPQPEVRVDGRAARLDDVIGLRWAVLGVGEAPAARMGPRARAHWAALGVVCLAVLPPEDAARAPAPEDAARPAAPEDAARLAAPEDGARAPAPEDSAPPTSKDPTCLRVEDLDGVVARWAARHGATQIVLRPDRFVFAVAGPEDADGPARAHERLVGAAVRRARPMTAARAGGV